MTTTSMTTKRNPTPTSPTGTRGRGATATGIAAVAEAAVAEAGVIVIVIVISRRCEITTRRIRRSSVRVGWEATATGQSACSYSRGEAGSRELIDSA